MKVKIGIIGGTGLHDTSVFANGRETTVTTPFGQPSGNIVEGQIAGVDCVLLPRHGPQHTIPPHRVNYRANIWALKQAGCTHVLVSTACGSLQEHIKPGDIVILDSFIDRTRTREQTFYDGGDASPKGICHLPMEPAFCERTREILVNAALELGVRFHETGTAVTIEGPRFSSKAESLIYRQWGAHVVNMTTVPEVVLAKEAGMCYAALALATDYDCWRDDGYMSVDASEVLVTFRKNVGKLKDVMLKAIPRIAEADWTETLAALGDSIKSSTMLAQ